MQNGGKLIWDSFCLFTKFTSLTKIIIHFFDNSSKFYKITHSFKVRRGGVATSLHFKAYSRLFTLMHTYVYLCKILQYYANLCIIKMKAYMDCKSGPLLPHSPETLHNGETSFHYWHTKCQHWLDGFGEHHMHICFWSSSIGNADFDMIFKRSALLAALLVALRHLRINRNCKQANYIS